VMPDVQADAGALAPIFNLNSAGAEYLDWM
jgi:hypothetical protein